MMTDASAPTNAMLEFPSVPAACAELLLADRKDAVYEGEVKNLLRELLERCFGSHLLSQLLPELSSASALLYYVLVLGRAQPQQTLGEEFCDILRATPGVKEAAGTTPAMVKTAVTTVPLAKHLAWLALAIAPRYIVARSQSGWLRLAQLAQSPRERMARQLRERQAAEAATAAAAAVISESGVGEEAAENAMAASAAATPVQPRVGILQWLLSFLDRFSGHIRALLASIEERIVPSSSEITLTVMQHGLAQFHLAFFYLYAKYLDVAKRLAGVQYVFVRNNVQPALNLSLLGYLMIIRLTTTLGMELRTLHRLHRQNTKAKFGALHAAGSSKPPARVPTAVVPVSKEDAAQQVAVRARRRRKCALCLGERVSPATTPCGHVFCWECIVGWCQKNKPECPLCRQETHPQQIKCIYNYS